MIIQHNISSLNAWRNTKHNNNSTSKNLDKLSSGFKINRAADDAAGLAISEKMRGQIRGLSMAEMNVQHGIAMIQTAEGGCDEIHAILQRMRELSVQSSNGTYQDEDRNQLESVYQELKSEITRIAESTHFNGTHLLIHDEASHAGGAVKPGTNGIPELGDWEEGGSDVIQYDLKDLEGVSGTYVDGSPGAINETLHDWFGIAGAFIYIETDTGDFASGLFMFDLIIEANGDDPPTLYVQSVAGTEVTKGDYNQGTGEYIFNHNDILVGPTTIRLRQGDVAGINSQIQGGFGSGVIRHLSITDSVGTGHYADFPAGLDMNTPILSQTPTIFDDACILLHENVLPQSHPAYTPGDASTSGGEGSEDGGVILQIGANGSADQRLTVNRHNLRSTNLGDGGVKLSGMSISTRENANSSINIIDQAINQVSSVRAYLGATQNRLEHTQNNLGVTKENLIAAESSIRDVDMAKEMMGFTKNNILVQSAQAMLAQSNQLSQGVLQLLR